MSMKDEMEQETVKKTGSIGIRGYYELQDTREALKSMIRDMAYRLNEGIGFHEELDEGQEAERREGYDDKQIGKIIEQLKEEDKINERERLYLEKLNDVVSHVKDYEKEFKEVMGQTVETEPIRVLWLDNVRGIGPILASNLVQHYGYCESYDTVSQLWSHSGMDPEGAKGRTKGEKISYDPKKKTLAWKIYDSFNKATSQPYRGIYESELERQKKRIELKEEGRDDEYKGSAPNNAFHAQNRAKRKAVKIFLQHYWVIARQLRGLNTVPPYVHRKLKHDNYIKPPGIPSKLKPFDTMREEHWICDRLDECVHPTENCKS